VRILREWPADESTQYLIEPSPDKARALIMVIRQVPCEHEEHATFMDGDEPEISERTHWEISEYAVYDIGTESWIDLTTDTTRVFTSWWIDSWAGPRTIAWSGEDYLALESIDDPGKLVYVVD